MPLQPNGDQKKMSPQRSSWQRSPFHGSGPTTGPRCRIWWDDQVLAYRIQTPYNDQFVEAIKKLIPASDRSYDPDTKLWLFTERYFNAVETLAKAVWPSQGEVLITTKTQTQSTNIPPTVAKQDIKEVCERFLRVLPHAAALSAYRAGARTLHPDAGGDLEKMSQLNVLWNRIEKEIYGK